MKKIEIEKLQVEDIIQFFKENCVGVTDFTELDFSVHCDPKQVYLCEENGRPFPVSDDFFRGVIFSNFNFFKNEVKEIQEDMFA